MSDRIVTLTVPEDVYLELEAQAHAGSRSIDEVVVNSLRRQVVPVEPDLPVELQDELRALEHLSDDALWQIAGASMNPDKVALWDLLLERKQDGQLTLEGQELLTRRREDGDALTLRKAHAYLLLKRRGHIIPTLDELHAEAV